MKRSMKENKVRKYIEAFADGELDVEQNLRVLEYMAMNPDATRRVMHQQQLRQVVDRAMREMSPAPADELRARIEQLADEARQQSMDEDNASVSMSASASTNASLSTSGDVDGGSEKQADVIARLGRMGVIRRWAPSIAAAVMLAVAAWLYFNGLGSGGAGDGSGEGSGTKFATDGGAGVQLVFDKTIVSDSAQKAFLSRHGTCATQLDHLHKADVFGQSIAELPTKVSKYLGQDNEMPVLNLAALGYQFTGAGQCYAPGGKAVHLVYKDENGKAMSLWVRAGAADELKIKPGKLYAAAADGKVNPVLVWRRGSHVYYLVGDTADDVKKAAQTLALK